MAGIIDLLVNFAPNLAGLVVAVFVSYVAFRQMNKIATNALHGQADTNLKMIASITDLSNTNVKVSDTLCVISKTLIDHSASDALVFSEIKEALNIDRTILDQRTGLFVQIVGTQNKIVENLSRQNEILAKLEDRTRELR